MSYEWKIFKISSCYSAIGNLKYVLVCRHTRIVAISGCNYIRKISNCRIATRREILKIFIHKTLPYVLYNTKFTLRILAKFMNEMKRKSWHFVLCDGTVRKTFWVLSSRDVTHTSLSKPAVCNNKENVWIVQGP